MIVCLCKGISDRTVQRAIDEGACSVEAVSRACGAATDCGGCTGTVVDMLRAGRSAPRSLLRSGLKLAPVGVSS